MYNKPDLGNYNSKNNYSPFNDQRVLHSDNINIRPVVYHEEVDDDDYKIVVSIDELLPDREIEIFYENNTLIATQKNTDKETINSSNERKNLKICVLDNMKVTFGPSELNPSEILNIYHEENKIYIHQGSKPECLRDGGIRTPDVPKNNEDNRPDQELSIKDGTIMCVIKKDFKLNKLVGIYYRDNEIFVSQRGSPINYNLYDETIAADLRYVGSDKTKIFLDPKKIDPMKKICIMHRDNSIYIFQGRKPDLSLRENKPDEIKYLPEDSNPDVRERNPRTNNSNIVSASDINNNNNNNKTPVPEITRKLPKPDNEKSKSVLDITFASGETFNICPSEFDKEKAFLILFENNLMKVTQIGAPRIRLSIGKKNELSIIKSDEYKLVVIPAAFHSQAELKIRHENGKIYFWIGTDELPNVNIDSPYRVEVVERDSIFSERPRNIDPMPEIFESGKVHVLLPLEFRFVQLVSIALDDNHKLNVTQKGAPFEDPSYIPSREYKNFKIMTSDRNKLLLHPRKVDSYRYLHIKHDNDNGLIYVSSGTPEYPFVNTNVSDIIEIIKPDPKVNAAPGSIDKIPQSGDRPSAPKSMGPEPGHRQPVYNNGSVVPGSTGPVFGYRPPVHKNGSPIPESKQPVPEHMESEPGYKQPVHNNEPPIPESKQPVPNFKGSEPGYKQPVHNNESPIPESMQPVPEHKEFEPGYKQPAHNNRSPIPESKQPVPESKASEPGYKQPVHNNEPPKPESKQLVPESKGSEPGYKQPVHNNGLPIPESMQPVPEHKGSEPDHTTSYPYDVKPKPDHKPSEPDDLTIPAISKSVDDSLPVVLTSNMFNLNKLVVISHKKHKINVYQTDRDDDYDEDDNENNSGYTDLHYSIPKRGTVTFDPRKINPNKMIIINYINKKIHVNSAEL
ncbi:uncharacterized protein LOC130673127 [Microplitis mediator]|uniref:uncharacterized protein LOC130673127 n=1 Tax=Microplitis mediator TaxID=375433 RepID=UPI002556E43C|nr:uncharacterized protein LOC130673127 [Microplitis mediator]